MQNVRVVTEHIDTLNTREVSTGQLNLVHGHVDVVLAPLYQ